MAGSALNVLIIEQRDDMRSALHRELESAGHNVQAVDSLNAGLGWLKVGETDVVLLSLTSDAHHPVTDVKILRQAVRQGMVVVMGAAENDQLAPNVLGAGADGFIPASRHLDQLADELGNLLLARQNDTMPRAAQDAPTQFGPYTVVHPMEHRGPARVFLVERKGLRYELYTLQRHGEADHELAESNQRFMRAALVASGIDHPHLIRIVDVELGNRHQPAYYVTDHLEGETLRHYWEHHPELGTKGKVRLLQQVAGALAVLHQQHVTVRALTPESILVTPGGMAKIIDLYSAHVPSSSLTHVGELVGVPHYEAPECAHTSDIGPVADVFSLGCLGYELLTELRAFHGKSLSAVLKDIQKGRPKRPSKIKSDLPKVLDDILGKMLRKEPEHRYQSMQEISKDLDAFLNDEKPPIAGHHGFTEGLFERVWA